MQASKSLMAAGLLLAGVAGPGWAQTQVQTQAQIQAKPDNGPVVVTAAKTHRPTEAPPPLEAYATPARVEHMVMSADGAQVAYVMTQGAERLLVTQRLADNTARLARLTDGPVSSIAWADDDHVLVTSGITTLRGTCDPNDQQEIDANVMQAQLSLQNQAIAQSSNPRGGSMVAQNLQAAAAVIGATSHSHPCVYYGVREESAVTSVDMATKSYGKLGARFGEHASRPLGTPARIALGGKPALAGPFMQVSLDSLGTGPAEPIFLWSVDPKTTGGRLLKDGGDLGRAVTYVDDWLVDPSGGVAARSLYDYGKSRFVIQMKQGGAWKPVLTRPVSPKTDTFAPFLVGLGAHDGSVVILDAAQDGVAQNSVAKDDAGRGSRLFHYYELSPDGALSGPLEPDDAARDRPIVNPATGRIAGFLRVGVEERYALTDPDLQSLFQKALNAAPGETVRIVSTADDPRKMVIHAEGRDDPGSYHVVDFSQGTSVRLGEDYPQIPSPWVAPQSLISYQAADGLQISALLTLPPGSAATRNLPLVVLPHDGPQAHDRRGFDWLAQALASRGYLVLQPQYRGSDGDGAAVMLAASGQLGRKMQSDLADGVRLLVSQGLADARRVCIVGAGIGGYAALMGATEAGTYRCAASIDGVSDLKAYETALRGQLVRPEQDRITPLVADLARPRDFDANPASPGILAGYMGSEPPVPVKLAASVAVPVLLVHETSDKTSPVQQSRSMRDALLAAGKPVELVEVAGPSDHALATHDARLAVLQAVLGFLAKNDPAG